MVRLIWLALVAPVWGARLAVDHESETKDGFTNPEVVSLHGGADGVLLEAEQHEASERSDSRRRYSTNALDDRQMRNARRLMSYGWYPDTEEPNYLEHRAALFTFQDDDITATRETTSDSEWIRQESLEDSSNEISANMQLRGCQGAFSGSLAGEVSRGSHHSQRQMVSIFRSLAEYAKVQNNAAYIDARLTTEARKYIQDHDAHRITDMFGQFYATQMTLGGVVRTIFQQTRTEHDSYGTFQAQVEAGYRVMGARASASAGASSEHSATGTSESLHVRVDVQGGDTTIMLSGGDWAEMQRDWSDTVSQDLYPVSFELRPLWEVVKEVDRAKGDAVETLVRSLWRDGSADLQRLDSAAFADPTPCGNCDLVPWGQCQEGCSHAQGWRLSNGTSKNWCANNNRGRIPTFCLRRCDSCDLVPWGQCQEGCDHTLASNRRSDGVSRNWCANNNRGRFPETCLFVPE